MPLTEYRRSPEDPPWGADRRWGDEAARAHKADDRETLDRLVSEATESGDPVAVLVCKAWRGDLGDVL